MPLPFERSETKRRIVLTKEVVFILEGFLYVRAMPCSFDEVRIDGSKEYALAIIGFALPLERSESCRKARKPN